ncbi:MAG: hypothetical protein IKN63_04870 [Bacilli bacterium]|nr:hypothetical protein [Bacilli bacterium]
MSNENKKKRTIITIVAMVLLVIVTASVTYAFFSYTRTGSANTISAGRISFNSQEGNAINLSNAFPISSTQAATDTTNAKTLAITVTGDTDYTGGIEYLVTADDVHMTVGSGQNAKTIPVAIEVSVSGNGLGSAETGEYYTNRSSYTTSKYKVEYDGTLDEDDHLLVGFIAPNTTAGTIEGVNGTINIKAYIDSDRVLISDTYPEGEVTIGGHTYYNGTPATDKMVFTTTEWNSITGNNSLSFKVKVEAREGTWVDEPPKNLANHIISRVGQDGIVAINTSGDLASSGDTIREYRYSGGGRYCTYENNGTTYNLQVEGDTCDETAIFGGGPPSLYRTTSDARNYGDLNGTTYTRTTITVQETNLKNYIWFNNEMWRIVGIVDGNLKIVKDVPITTDKTPTTYTNIAGTTFNIKDATGSYANNKYAAVYWNSIKTTNYNDWTTAGGMYWTNEDNTGSYYNTINSTYKNMILESNYYLRNVTTFGSGTIGTASTVYNEERATPVMCESDVISYSHNSSCNIWNGNQTSWTGKVALLYPSDFGYASSSSNWNKQISSYWQYGQVINDNWLLNNDAYYNWFLSPASYSQDVLIYWSASGYIWSISSNNSAYVNSWRPVLNLKANTLIYSGDGSYNNPYKLIQ